MSHSTPNTSLSLSARLLCYLGPPSTILLTATASPKTALLSPLAFLPTVLSLKKWREANNANPSRRGELEPMAWTFTAAGTLGLTTVVLVQVVAFKAAIALLFGSGQAKDDFLSEFQRNAIQVASLSPDELARRAQLAMSWQNWVFNAILTFGIAGVVEETLKYLPIAYARRRGTDDERKPRDRAYVDYAVAGALGFVVVEGIGFLYASVEAGNESWSRLSFTLFERMVIGTSGHLLVGALTGLRAIRRDYYGDQLSWLSVVGPSMLLHGAFDFVAMSGSALEGNVGWIHPQGLKLTAAMLAGCASIVATAAWKVRQEWIGLTERDRRSKKL